MDVLIRPLALLAALSCASLTGCTSESGGASASCALVIEYRGHTYSGTGEVRRDPVTTGRQDQGVRPACDDSGGQDEGVPEKRAAIEELAGVTLDTGFLSADTVYVREDSELLAATRVWFRAPRCASARTFELTADWFGINGPEKVWSDGDVRPPYRIEVHVTKGPPAYVGATIAVHADAGTDPALGPAEVKGSLWKGGQVIAQVGCVNGRFRAQSLSVLPGS